MQTDAEVAAKPDQIPPPAWCGCYPDPVDGLDYICDRHLELGVTRVAQHLKQENAK